RRARSRSSFAAVPRRAQVVLEECERALERERCAGRVVWIRVDVAVECVAGRIDVDRRVGQRLAMAFDRGGWNGRIPRAEMELDRRAWFFVEEADVACAVVADRGQAEPGRGEERDRATPAIADAADAPRRCDRLRRARDVG